MKNILIISYVFPPIAYGGTFRLLRMSRYLGKYGLNVTVLTVNVNEDLQNDFELLDKIPKHIRIIRTKTIDPWVKYQTIKNIFKGNLFGRIIDRAINAFFSVFNQPDHMVFWLPFAVIKGVSLVKHLNIDCIYTSSPPHSTQFIGYILNKLTGVRWISDYRDPITDNIAFNHMTAYERLVNKICERVLLANVDHVIVNTKHAENLLKNRFNKLNISTIRNSYDPNDFKSKNTTKPSQMFTISHIGSIYSFRKIDSLISSVYALAKANIISPDNFCVCLLGIIEKKIIKQIEDSSVSQYFKISGVVSHTKAIGIMMKSNLLLLIKGFGKNSAGQIPGKLFEYIGSGQKILYLGPDNSEAADIIKEVNNGYIVENDINYLKTILEYEFLCWKNNSNKIKTENANIIKFSSDTMAKKLADIICNI